MGSRCTTRVAATALFLVLLHSVFVAEGDEDATFLRVPSAAAFQPRQSSVWKGSSSRHGLIGRSQHQQQRQRFDRHNGCVPFCCYENPTARQQHFKASSSAKNDDGDTSRSSHDGDDKIISIANSSQPQQLGVTEVDVLYNRRTGLAYDPALDRFVDGLSTTGNYIENDGSKGSLDSNRNWFVSLRQIVAPRLSVAFLPSGVTPNYYDFMRWRIVQRFVNANLHVFGTQSLLLGLGMKSRLSSSSLGALSAALNWVLKDALGKIVRMLWASRMGRRFDSDAKRWRFRSALVYATGNFLEIVTFICPNLFLVWATMANCFKQVSMLTSSSTRAAIYTAFQKTEEKTIADITAKGEAQIAVVDLLGIASGVTLSRIIGTSVRKVLAIYFVLQAMEIACMYRELRSVQYRVFNYERMVKVISCFCSALDEGTVNGDIRLPDEGSSSAAAAIPTPNEIAATERIFLPPEHLSRRKVAFGSLGRARLSPGELLELLSLFERERFLLVVGANVKNPPRQLNMRFLELKEKDGMDSLKRQASCHIVLHEKANNKDIVKSTLALTLLRRKLANADSLDPEWMRSGNCMQLIKEAYRECDKAFSLLNRELNKKGWESPARFMFGRVSMRASWPLATSRDNGKANAS